MSLLNATIKKFKKQDSCKASVLSVPPVTQSSPKNRLNVIIRKRQLKKNLVKFLHQSLFSPRPSTLLKAVKKNFLASFPGLTPNLVQKHLETSVPTELGHLRQE